MQQLELIILFHCLQISIMFFYNFVCYEYNEMSNMRNHIRFDIDKYCIKQEDDEIFAHTHNISIDDVRVAIKHLKM